MGAQVRRSALAAGLPLLLVSPWQPVRAALLRYCDTPTAVTATQQDKLLRLAAVIKTELEASGQRLALVARSGTDLRRFDQRYSHAGISLKASPNAPWSVRQLYYACDERLPRLFDQGLPGFLLGTDDPTLGYVSVLLLPGDAAAALEPRALDNALALQLLGRRYSANAYAFSTRYQNCNQWVLELAATAWGAGASGPGAALDADPRARAQAWLQAVGYRPTVFELGSRALQWFATAIPWVHDDDHPREDLMQARFRVSMPASIEAFVQARWPTTRRLEFCHTDQHIVIRRGWQPLAEGCQPQPLDEVIALAHTGSGQPAAEQPDVSSEQSTTPRPEREQRPPHPPHHPPAGAAQADPAAPERPQHQQLPPPAARDQHADGLRGDA